MKNRITPTARYLCVSFGSMGLLVAATSDHRLSGTPFITQTKRTSSGTEIQKRQEILETWSQIDAFVRRTFITLEAGGVL